MSDYRPTLSAQEAEDIRLWHERAYAARLAEGGGGEQTVDYLGFSIVVPPYVQPVTGVSHLLGRAVLAEVQHGDRVLDMGTGSGVNAILAASKGAQVVAVDINPDAVAAARANADRNGMRDRIEVRHGDVFSSVTEDFDVIVFDPPFRWFAPRDLTETATTDEGYRAMTTFFQQARGHLTTTGRMLIFFGTSGDLGYLKQLMAAEGFGATVVAHEELTRGDRRVEYFTFLAA